MNIVLVIVKLFFFLMIRPPPRSTLFPSTPLFRSDRLVPEGVLELARREARRVLVGKERHGSSCRQEDITDLLVRLRSEEHTSELQSRQYLVCRLLLEKQKTHITNNLTKANGRETL